MVAEARTAYSVMPYLEREAEPFVSPALHRLGGARNDSVGCLLCFEPDYGHASVLIKVTVEGCLHYLVK